MNPEYIIIHHAASGTPSKNVDLSARQIDEIHRGFGWRGIGYHYVIRFDGTVEPGRPDNEQGAHARGWNSRSLGICVTGNADYHSWTTQQVAALTTLARTLMDNHKIPIKRVLGHREVNSTDCPGKLVNMDKVRGWLNDTTTAIPPDVPDYDATGMFCAICKIFDDPHWGELPQDTRKLVKELRHAKPFATMNREDLG
jgi:hypothetical protein